MKAHPFLYSSLVAALITSVVVYSILVHGPFPVLVAYLLGINLATFLLYRYDKLVSETQGKYTRIPERVLLGIALVGGSPAAFVGMHVQPHHKTSKASFQLSYWFIVVLQVALGYCLFLDTNGVCEDTWECILGIFS